MLNAYLDERSRETYDSSSSSFRTIQIYLYFHYVLSLYIFTDVNTAGNLITDRFFIRPTFLLSLQPTLFLFISLSFSLLKFEKKKSYNVLANCNLFLLPYVMDKRTKDNEEKNTFFVQILLQFSNCVIE